MKRTVDTEDDFYEEDAHGRADPRGGSAEDEEEAERVFAALPPARGRGFARTWWGVSWQRALEDSALDSEQLRKGRRYARSGAVGAVSVRPGRITAMVRERDGTAHRADVLVQRLDGDSWQRLLEVTACTAGHLAALLDGVMPPELVEDAHAVQVRLLPQMGDLHPECDCGEWDHCPHTAAVCYQLARLLDEDPLILLLLLGRGEQQLLAQLRRLSLTAPDDEPAEAAVPCSAQVALRTEPAGEAYAVAPGPLPAPPPLPQEPPGVPDWKEHTASPAELDVTAVALLAWDAATRAREALSRALTSGHAEAALLIPLSRWQDAVRLAAVLPASHPAQERLMAGRTPDAFRAAVAAWRLGGRTGLAVLDGDLGEAGCGSAELARAADQLASAWREEETAPALVSGGEGRWRVRDRDLQLRYSGDGRWWPCRLIDGHWGIAGSPGPDPAVVLAQFGPP